MSQTTAAAGTTLPSRAVDGMSFVGRVIGVFTSPRATYADIAARPRWLPALALVLAVLITGSLAFFSTEVGRQAMLDQQVRTMESFGMTITDPMYQQMQAGVQRGAVFTAAGQLVFVPVMTLVIAGIGYIVFNAILGGDAAFKQLLGIVSHAGFVFALQQIFSLPLAYARQTLSGATNLAVFAPFLDDTSFLAQLLGSIDLFIVWWIVSLSIGLGVLYRKRTGPIATSLLGVYVLIGLAIATVKSLLAGA